jgi:acyl-coenzyme A synthetase/AMP-(fatty) acid ligase
MTATALSAALTANTEHVACFGRDGVQHRWPQLVAAASRVCVNVRETAEQRWALNLDDSFEFAAALLGCWAAGKTPVLAPSALLASADQDIAIDGVIQAADAPPTARKQIVWQHLTDTRERITSIAATAQLVLYTSGTTGNPKEVRRCVRNIEAELAVLESLWGAGIGASRVYATVAHRHVYGLLFRVLWPLLARRPLATFDLQYPEQLVDGGGTGQVLVASPALLKRIGHLPAESARWRAVFSSGGLLPEDAAADTMRVLGAAAIEVLGSTETSGVAWRQQSAPGATSWRALPSVAIRVARDEHLEVRSPFSGEPDWLHMGDRVQLADDGAFALLGRGDHVVKIEDKRISLAQIERFLMDSPWIADAAAVALHDAARQYVGVVLKLSDSGTSELARHGRSAFNEHLKESLRARIEAVALPRKFRYLEQIPVDAQGKRQRAVLEDLFGPQ